MTRRDSEGQIRASKIAWNAVFGRLGSLGGQEQEQDRDHDQDVCWESDEEEWEDLDDIKKAEIERKKRILKGQIARAAVRSREREGEFEEDTLMSTRRDGVAASQEGQGRTNPRRLSTGRAANPKGPPRDPTCLLYTSPSPRD